MSSHEMPHGVINLPPEIITLFCALLPRSDLKNVRLVCKGWEIAARRPLYSRINLKVCIDSFDRLQKISTHAGLSTLVKSICYDSRILEKLDVRHDFDSWFHGSSVVHDGLSRCRPGLGDGLGLSFSDRRRFITQFTRIDLEKAFRAYCQSLIKQELILEGSNETHMLAYALRGFPNLSSIEISNTSPIRNDFEVLGPVTISRHSLKSEAREILQGRKEWTYPNDTGLRFWSFYRAAVISNRVEQLEKIRGYALDIGSWGLECSWYFHRFGQELCKLIALKSVALEFKYGFLGNGFLEDGSIAEEAVLLGTFLSLSTSLVSLELSFEVEKQYALWEDTFNLGTIFTKRTHWQHLKNLSLRAVTVQEGVLRSVLRNHTSTLRELELINIRLDQNTDSVVLGPECWVYLIIFLHDSLSLSKVNFYGTLDTSDYNGWITIDKPPMLVSGGSDASAADSEDCFRRRVENYITHQGLFPFTTHPSGGIDLPWIFQEDESWYLDGSRRMPVN